MKRRIGIRISAWAIVAASALFQTCLPGQVSTSARPGAGVVTGTVLDESQKPVSGARVSVTLDLPVQVKGRVPEPFLPFRAIYQTGQDGVFQATNLPKGRFRVCASAPGRDYVDGCTWNSGVGSVSLAEAQEVKAPALVLNNGFRMKIRINDANGIVARDKASILGNGLVIGVATATAAFVPAQATGADKAGIDMDVVVPFDLRMRFVAISKGLKLADEAGKAADAAVGVNFEFSVPAGTKALPPLTVGVTGTADVSGVK